MSENERVLVWFSDGAASAVALWFAVKKYGKRVKALKCDTTSTEHPDNERFRAEISAWTGIEIELIRSNEYKDIDDVFERTRWMAGVEGARCTTELKKKPRREFSHDTDIHIFGYTWEEERRIRDFEWNNPHLKCDWILRTEIVMKSRCFRILERAGIKLPEMYALGFEHNNCLGCVKATSPAYWQRTRREFPEVFERRARQSRAIGCRLVRFQGERIFLDELPANYESNEPEGDIECGPFCNTASVNL